MKDELLARGGKANVMSSQSRGGRALHMARESHMMLSQVVSDMVAYSTASPRVTDLLQLLEIRRHTLTTVY